MLPSRFRLNIAGIRLAVHADPSLDLSGFDARADAFADETSAPSDECLEVGPFASSETPPSFSLGFRCEAGPEGRVVVDSNGARLTFSSARSAAGDQSRVHTAKIDLKVNALAFENLLRIWVSRHLLERGGVLLHAAGIYRDGHGIAFPGVSGTGKSTVTLREPEAHWISEDLLAVQRRPNGTGWMVHSLPFLAANRLSIPRRRAPLHAFAFIRHAKGVHLEPIRPQEVLSHLARTLVSFAPIGLEQCTLVRLLELSEALPSFAIGIDRTTPYWPELIKRLPESPVDAVDLQ
ncbi:MAG: hypothetical protein NVSMB1_19000 [Polyangiales bacterium]